jgi:hypothetical protein
MKTDQDQDLSVRREIRQHRGAVLHTVLAVVVFVLAQVIALAGIAPNVLWRPSTPASTILLLITLAAPLSLLVRWLLSRRRGGGAR